MIARRREIRDRYAAALADRAGRALPRPRPTASTTEATTTGSPASRSTRTGAVAPTTSSRASTRADIEARHLWKPMHLQPVHRAAPRRSPPAPASSSSHTGSPLPSGSGLDRRRDRPGHRRSPAPRCGVLRAVSAVPDGKRALDLALAVPALVLSLPVQARRRRRWCAVELGRPVLFRQQRPGLHGVPFKMVKFRTMLDPDPAAGWSPTTSGSRRSAPSCARPASTSCPPWGTSCAATCRWSARARSWCATSTATPPSRPGATRSGPA